MNDKLKRYLDQIFLPYEDLKSTEELKEELYQDLQEKFLDLKTEGIDDEAALQKTIDSIGDISELIESINTQTNELRRVVGMNLSMSNLKNSDLQAVQVHDGKFNYSNLQGSDFRDSDLTNSTFKCSNLDGAKFDRANLTGAKLNRSNLQGASFTDAILDDTDFSYSNVSGICFDGIAFNGTVFDRAGLKGSTFRNAIFKNVSFKTDVKKVIFDGATMDKITYAILQGYGAKLQNVKVV